MYRSILVPLDGSHFSEHALPVAASIARRRGADLTVVRVHNSTGTGVATTTEAVLAQRWQEEQAYLCGIVHRLAGAMKLPVRDCLLHGEIVDSLLQYVQDRENDLVVMTTHGRNAFSRLWLGSVAEELLLRLPIPLLLIRPQTCLPVYSRMETFRNVLIALDGSTQAEEIIQPLLALDLAPETSYTLLHVILPLGSVSQPTLADDAAQLGEPLSRAQSYLEQIAARLRKERRRVEIRIRNHRHPAATILQEMSRGIYDLLALATDGQSRRNRLFVSSVTEQIIRKVFCPLFTVKTRLTPALFSEDDKVGEVLGAVPPLSQRSPYPVTQP